MSETNRLRRALSRWGSAADQEARDLRADTAASGRMQIAEAPDRARAVLRGTLSTVTLRPRGGVPALEAELYDGSGTILLIWLGRRRIIGISPGRRIEVEGRIGVHDGERVIYNPRYDLKAESE